MSDAERQEKEASDKKIRELSRENAKLKQAAANGKDSAKKGPNPQVKAIIRSAVKSDIWRLCKFFQDEDDQDLVTKKLIKYAGIESKDEGVALDPKSEEP